MNKMDRGIKSFNNFVINGDFSKEFLESLGIKKIEFPLFEIVKEPTMPRLEEIKVLFPKIENYRGWEVGISGSLISFPNSVRFRSSAIISP